MNTDCGLPKAAQKYRSTHRHVGQLLSPSGASQTRGDASTASRFISATMDSAATMVCRQRWHQLRAHNRLRRALLRYVLTPRCHYRRLSPSDAAQSDMVGHARRDLVSSLDLRALNYVLRGRSGDGNVFLPPNHSLPIDTTPPSLLSPSRTPPKRMRASIYGASKLPARDRDMNSGGGKEEGQWTTIRGVQRGIQLSYFGRNDGKES